MSYAILQQCLVFVSFVYRKIVESCGVDCARCVASICEKLCMG